MTTPDPIGTAGARAALSLLESARMHKRMAAQHRRAARECMSRAEELRGELGKLGIGLIVQPTEGEAGGTHGPHSDTRPAAGVHHSA